MTKIELSEPQFMTLVKLSRGERVTFIPPITRRWLQRQGYITVSKPDKTKPGFRIEITDLGREIIQHATKVLKS